MPTPNHWIWVFGEIRGLRWVLEHGTMAFAEHAWSRVKTMNPGDEATLYVTRGGFHNPTKDRARLAGLATVTAEPRRGDPVGIAEREFSLFVDFDAQSVTPERQGPEVASWWRGSSGSSGPRSRAQRGHQQCYPCPQEVASCQVSSPQS